MDTLQPTDHNRLFYRLRVQALIRDLRGRFGDDEAFDIIAHAVRQEMSHAQDADSDRRHHHPA